MWRILFVALLLINLIWLSELLIPNPFIGIVILERTHRILVLSGVNLIVIIAYIVRQKPQGKARVISDAAVIIMGLVLIVAAVLFYEVYNYWRIHIKW